MKGEVVPLVMIPRFTSYVGPGTYETAPIDVSRYARAILSIGRGPLFGGSSALTCLVQESHDQIVWHDLLSITAPNTTTDHRLTLTRRWFRIRIELTGSNAAITFWAAGGLEMRVE